MLSLCRLSLFLLLARSIRVPQLVSKLLVDANVEVFKEGRQPAEELLMTQVWAPLPSEGRKEEEGKAEAEESEEVESEEEEEEEEEEGEPGTLAAAAAVGKEANGGGNPAEEEEEESPLEKALAACESNLALKSDLDSWKASYPDVMVSFHETHLYEYFGVSVSTVAKEVAGPDAEAEAEACTEKLEAMAHALAGPRKRRRRATRRAAATK